jgi:hypothetical protein
MLRAADGDTPSLPKRDLYNTMGGRACCEPRTGSGCVAPAVLGGAADSQRRICIIRWEGVHVARRGRRHAVPPKEGLWAGRNQAGWAAAYQVFPFGGVQSFARFAVKIRVVA